MFGAIRLAGHWPSAAEAKIHVVGMAVGPHAARAAEFEDITPRRLRRGFTPRHRVTVKSPDDGIFGQPHTAPDLCGRQPLLKQLIQPLDSLRSPGDFHRFPRILWIPRSTPTKYGITLVTGCQQISISGVKQLRGRGKRLKSFDSTAIWMILLRAISYASPRRQPGGPAPETRFDRLARRRRRLE